MRNKSGLHPQLYSSLTFDEKNLVFKAMLSHNKKTGSHYSNTEFFYQNVYRAVLFCNRKQGKQKQGQETLSPFLG
jgi:hypothetical protein